MEESRDRSLRRCIACGGELDHLEIAGAEVLEEARAGEPEQENRSEIEREKAEESSRNWESMSRGMRRRGSRCIRAGATG